MSLKPAVGQVGLLLMVRQADRMPQIAVKCAVERLHVDADRRLEQAAKGRHLGATLTRSGKFKGNGEITWRQIGRQGKGGAN